MSRLSSIDEYLDLLADSLQTSPRRTRRILAETEDHLRSASRALIERGIDPEAAEDEAIARFGTVEAMAHGFNRQNQLSLLPRLEAITVPLLSLLAVGLIAIGASGLLAFGISTIAGKEYVAGDQPGVTYTAARCTDFLEYHPEAPDCATAATRHHFDEVVAYRIAAGILGLAALAAYFVARRVLKPSRLPGLFAPTIGTTLFGLAGAGFTVVALGQTLTDSNGAGSYLSAGLVAGLVALIYAMKLIPQLAPSTE
jgi:hypothetical protein